MALVQVGGPVLSFGDSKLRILAKARHGRPPRYSSTARHASNVYI